MEAHIKKFITSAIAPLKMAMTAWAQLLIRCTVGDDVFYFAFAAGNADAGAVPFRAGCVRCSVI